VVNFGDYLRQLVKIVFSSSVALGLVIGIALLIVGETSMNFEVGLEIETIDSVWVALGLPLLAVLVFLAVSPLSIFIYRLLPRRHNESVRPDP
jgi:uncharacterized BrkB/YihY/UPF0761 family membrane protein